LKIQKSRKPQKNQNPNLENSKIKKTLKEEYRKCVKNEVTCESE
jgi:hypothetical protein